ncbi:MAG: hypothetical protein A2511_01375 [Deltaproteobacteria bacterium RIFOXYD12_FULL_50_9]|nr:MAG: hypothetical protein A2511_01375 [Deltaproteobacteria bacterium RIFOXYD12_FULL_50_9]
MNTVMLFKQAMRNTGIKPPDEILADGCLHRFTVYGDKPQSKNGWYVFHDGDLATGAFGCWKRQVNEAWSSEPYQSMTPEEQTAYKIKMANITRQRTADQKRIQAECRAWCANVWPKAQNATSDNPYLRRKGVKAYGVKVFEDTLLVPVQDLEGAIHGMQFIAPDGSKRFKTGTNKVGHFFKIGMSKENIVIICEGYSTGATIHEATGHAVVVAFDAGNLLPVAQRIRSRFCDMKIILAADDDKDTEGNPGISKAIKAARAVGGLLVYPLFEGGS